MTNVGRRSVGLLTSLAATRGAVRRRRSWQAGGVADQEVPLQGGKINQGIVRVGNTVRRPLHPWSTTVHALLQHLERVGFEGAPRFLGIDERGREVLSFLEGETLLPDGWRALARSHELREIGQLVRAFHDATEGFRVPPGATWSRIGNGYDPKGGPLVVHNDLGPWNIVVGPAFGLIDWDFISPGRAEWDLAYLLVAVGWFWEEPPPWQAGQLTVGEVVDRVAAIAEGYGADEALTRTALLLVPERCRSVATNIETTAAAGHVAFARLVEDGDPAGWRREADRADGILPAVLKSLSLSTKDEARNTILDS